MEDKIKIIGLGGLDEDGKNLTIIEINNDIFVVDAGIKFPDKTTPGIDYIIPDYNYLKENKSKIKGYIITHGHDDQLGALPYIYKHCPAPVFCSNVTKIILLSFVDHIDSNIVLDIHEVEPTSSIEVSGHKINFFHTAHNIANSMGVCFETSLGNIIYSGDYVVEYTSNENYLHDLNAIGRLAEKETLVLMTESKKAEKLGYTSPKHRLSPLVSNVFENEAKGRIFISIFSTNTFNIAEVIKLSIENNRKIICYDEETEMIIKRYQQAKQLLIPSKNFATKEEIVRVREQDATILLSGFGNDLYKKIALLADGSSIDKRFILKESDTFIVACPPSLNMEVIATDAVDELYRTGATIHNLNRKKFSTMHASEQDIQMLLSIFKPKYYVPLKGSFRELIANATIAVNMGIGLTHDKVFVLDNGLVLEIAKSGAHILPDNQNAKVGDILIDGLGVGADTGLILKDRQLLGDDGLIVVGVSVSVRKRKIVSNIEIILKGFSFNKDKDGAFKEIAKILTDIIQDNMTQFNIDIEKIKLDFADKAARAIRRMTGKTPLIIPMIEEVE